MKFLIKTEPDLDKSNGLIKYIYSNNHLKSLIDVSFSQQQYAGDKNSFFHWGESFQLFDDNHSVFLRYSFKNLVISLSNYSFKALNNSCYAKTWELYGMNDEETIFLNKGDSSSICNFSIVKCDSFNVHIFPISSNYSNKTFSSFLFISNDGSCSNGNHFAASGIEFFGTLYSLFQPKITCKRKLRFIFHIFIDILILL